jgi:K+-transporting ATPase ATPase A chain
LLLGLYLLVLLALVKPLGIYIADVMEGRSRALRIGGPIEAVIYRLCGIRENKEMGWLHYALALLLFNTLGVFAVYALQRLQFWLPLNPQQMTNVSPDSAFNTAVSFVTNTNWQGYGGETTMSYLTQMLALTVQNFLSAATGIAVVIALIRGFARHTAQDRQRLGRSDTDHALRAVAAVAGASRSFLVSQGVIQNFDGYKDVTTLEVTHYDAPWKPLKDAQGHRHRSAPCRPRWRWGRSPRRKRSRCSAPTAAVSSTPIRRIPTKTRRRSPTLLEMLAIFLIPAALCHTFGRLVGDARQGWAVLAAMTVLFVVAAMAVMSFEQQGNPTFAALGVDQAAGNLEGKELRFGSADSALFAAVTTAASCGAVNAMHDSFTPLGGMVPLVLMQLGEVVFGGVGSGLYGMLVFAVMAVFIAGLMIGRTPEYLGKKIEVYEMKMMAIAILVTPLLVLGGTAVAVMTFGGRAGILNPGAHGFSEVLYAFTSAANNNGSAFAGLSANTPFYNVLLGISMWLGRFGIIVPVLAMAGSLAAKKRLAETSGSLPTHGPLFVALLVGTVLLVGLLNYVPALALGPVIEHLLLWAGR